MDFESLFRLLLNVVKQESSLNSYQYLSLLISGILSFASLIVAGITSFIAYYQYQMYANFEKKKFRFDLYEDRVEIYRAVKEMLCGK